jgi:transcriptional regulator with XRE-family HTH domain
MNRLKEILHEKGIKQTWLAEKLGKSFKMVNGYACNRQLSYKDKLKTDSKWTEIYGISIQGIYETCREK